MLIKQVTFKGVSETGEVLCQPILGGLLTKTASVEVRSKLHPKVQDFIRGIIPTPAGIYVLVNALGAGEYWGSNVNGDLFPEKALIHAPDNWEKLPVNDMRRVGQAWEYGFPTFMGAYPYKHHVNKDPSRAFGRVELAVWNPAMHRVELIVYLDRALCKQFDAYDVIERIERGEFPDVSMGCKVPYDVCTICEHRSKTRADYCEHAATSMNKILPDGRKVAVRNDFPKFFDISFVFIGADKTAKVMAKLAHQGNQVCLGDVCMLRSSAELGEMFSKQSGLVDALKEDLQDVWQRDVAGVRKARARIAQKTHSPYVNVKYASAKQRLTSAAVGAAIGGTGNAAGSHLFDRVKREKDKQKMKDEAGRDFLAGAVSGGLGGALLPFTKKANDPIKKKVEVQGVPIWIEWLSGDTRQYKDKKTGEVKYKRLMKAHYGYIPGTKDSDGEEIDVYLGPKKNAQTAYVIRQLKKSDGSFDEHKVMIGYASAEAARSSYDYHMGGTKEFFGGMKPVPVSALRALFGDNAENTKEEKEKKAEEACKCDGVCDPCGGSLDKLAEALFPVPREKSASHQKVSELIKSIPAGPFSKETLPRLEKTERDIPRDVLDLMGGLPLGAALSTPAMMGMILKPREFQRVVLVRMGEKPFADELDEKNMTFEQTNDIDEAAPVGAEHVDPRLKELLSLLGLLRDRSAAQPALQRRTMIIICGGAPDRDSTQTVSREPVMKKLAAAYNGYRRTLLKKAASIQTFLTTDPQLRADMFGESMAEAFAGGIGKVGSASVFGPDSLAYLVGAYTNRDLHTSSNEVVASLAHMGAVAEAA